MKNQLEQRHILALRLAARLYEHREHFAPMQIRRIWNVLGITRDLREAIKLLAAAAQKAGQRP